MHELTARIDRDGDGRAHSETVSTRPTQQASACERRGGSVRLGRVCSLVPPLVATLVLSGSSTVVTHA